jgi:hypothetical protein
MAEQPKLGPVSQCTLIATDGEAAVHAYTQWLHQQTVSADKLDAATAGAIGYPALAGARSWQLANASGRRWLQILECKDALSRDSLHSLGWMALEVLVENVDSLAASLEGSPFELLRPPADLDLGDKIRACQVRGPTGEVLYLTQIKGAVPPFQLPTCEAPVDHLFIPVLSTPSRAESLNQYAAISGNNGISFDTKITVLNQARGYNLDRRHPVATLQLAGRSLIELDQIENTLAPEPGIYSGMASVAFECAGEDDNNVFKPTVGPFAGRSVSAQLGCAGEHFTLVYP